jgi:CheY-like chemotaxis protein
MKKLPYVLMLEDDGDDRHLTKAFFKDQGYDLGLEFIEEAERVLPFLENCLESSIPLPGLIILDKNTPGKTGFEVLQEIKTNRNLRHVPVVMISGTAFPAEVAEAYRLGVNSYITKPVNHQLTVTKIDTCIRYWFEIVDLPQLV